MASPRKPGRPAKPTQAEDLLEALAFVDVATANNFPSSEYVHLSGKMAIGFNGQVSAGFPIVEELNVCPHLDKFKAALNRCGKSLVIGETPNGQISVKGDNLRALVPCMPASELHRMEPDAKLYPATDILKEAFKICATLASEAASRVVEASLLIDGPSITGTNGAAMLQYWLGFTMPPNVVIPKLFALAVAKQSKTIVGFGCDFDPAIQKARSLTVWFENGAWIKTACYADNWPSLSPILDVPSYPVPVNGQLFEAIEAVSHFNDAGTVVFVDGQVWSHDTDATGAQFPVVGLQGGKKFNGKLVKLIAPYVANIDLTTYSNKAFFTGGNELNPIRGAIMGFDLPETTRQLPNYSEPEDAE